MEIIWKIEQIMLYSATRIILIWWHIATIKLRDMAQSAMTVRMDSNIKNQFDKLCQQFGMSANTAINIFINQVIRSRSIPFVISASDNSENIRREALSAFRSARLKAEKSEDKELSLEEINKEIKEARKDRE